MRISDWSSDVCSSVLIQYSLTAIAIVLVALVLSALMRLQLGFPDTFSFITPENYLQAVSMHGMIMVVYLLTALFLGGFGNYLIPLMVGARDMVVPFVNMLSFWFYLLAVIILTASRSEEDTCELPSPMRSPDAVFCLH